jgi:GNAT superfamily N-acetyltransferase
MRRESSRHSIPAVVPEFRGRGIGRALLAEAERLAVDRGLCKLTLEVQETNTPARTLYERFGFVDFVVGESVTTLSLCKPLPAGEGASE